MGLGGMTWKQTQRHKARPRVVGRPALFLGVLINYPGECVWQTSLSKTQTFSDALVNVIKNKGTHK